MATKEFSLPEEQEIGQSGDAKYLSKEAFQKLKQQLEHLRTDARQEIAGRLEYAKSLGDLSENSEYAEAKDMQENNEARIAELENILSRTVLIKKTVAASTVDFGSTVMVQRKNAFDAEHYMIVGSEEANPLEGKISNESPLGRAFFGKKKGEITQVHTPSGVAEYTIVDIV